MLVTKMDIYFRKTFFLSQSQCHYIVNYILSSMCRTLTRELWNKVHPAIWSKSKFLIRDLISRMKQVIRLAVLIPIVPILTLPFSNVPSLDVNQLFNNERHYWSDVAYNGKSSYNIAAPMASPRITSKLFSFLRYKKWNFLVVFSLRACIRGPISTNYVTFLANSYLSSKGD